MHSQNHLQPIAVRSVRASQFNFNDKKLNVSGYVNETGKPSDPIPNWGETDQIPEDESFVEVMQPGVFRDAIKNADFVDFYMEHDPDKYLSSTREGTLDLTEDDTGLKMSANIVPTSWGQDTYTLIKSGAIKSMSFGFVPIDAEWDLSGVTPVRTVTKIQLLEVSAVRFPAYPDSSIDARKKHFKRLNQMLERRGFTLSNLKHKRGVNMTEKVVKNKEKRASNNTNPMMSSSDAQNLTTAINNMTNAIQENSEVQSNIAAKIMQAANNGRAKKDVHTKKSEKRDEKPAEKKPAKDPKENKGESKKPKEAPKNKKSKQAPKVKKEDPKPKEKSDDEKRAEKVKAEKQAKRAKKVNSMIKAMKGFNEEV